MTTVAGEVVEVEFARALVAPGSVPTIFPIPGLTEHAVGFKTLADAIWLRNRVLRQLDVAQATSDGEERRRHLTFTFVGGGYAGVEALAELESLARDAVVRYQGLGIGDFRWVLVEARETLLPGLHPKLAVFTERILRDRGVDLYLGTRLQSCLDKMVVLSDGVTPPYPSETIVWTAGQRPNPDVDDFGLPTDESGRVLVDAGMEVEGLPGVFVIGDAARAPVPEGGFAPMTAQHAVREAKVAAINISASLGIGKRTTLTYRNRGLAVTLGKWQGTAQVRRFTFTGPLGVVDGPVLPPADDPRSGPQGPGGQRLDDLAAVPSRRLPAGPAGHADPARAGRSRVGEPLVRSGLERAPGGPRWRRRGSRGPVGGERHRLDDHLHLPPSTTVRPVASSHVSRASRIEVVPNPVARTPVTRVSPIRPGERKSTSTLASTRSCPVAVSRSHP